MPRDSVVFGSLSRRFGDAVRKVERATGTPLGVSINPWKTRRFSEVSENLFQPLSCRDRGLEVGRTFQRLRRARSQPESGVSCLAFVSFARRPTRSVAALREHVPSLKKGALREEKGLDARPPSRTGDQSAFAGGRPRRASEPARREGREGKGKARRMPHEDRPGKNGRGVIELLKGL